MKYLEELTGGDCFEYGNRYYIMSKDFKSNGDIMCLGLFDGFTKWLPPNSMVNQIELLTTDNDKNIVALKRREKNDIS
jgi:hypothetical protein